MAYYVSGDNRAVKSLKLRLYVNEPELEKEAFEKFLYVSEDLLGKALGVNASVEIDKLLTTTHSNELIIENRTIIISRENWGNEPNSGHEITHLRSVLVFLRLITLSQNEVMQTRRITFQNTA